jgi:hypothetical protein
MLPSVNLTKTDGNTGVVTPSNLRVLAIIGPSSAGTAAQPVQITKASTAFSTFGYGELTEAAALVMSKAKRPVVMVKAAASTAATYSAVTLTGTGTSVPTAGVTAPTDDYSVVVTVVNGGTRGVDGITYTYSLDGGETVSAVQALGTATSIVIPNSGVTIALAAGTLVAGDVITLTTTGPKLTSGDISTALEALRTSALQWEAVLVVGHAAVASTVSALDTWLSAREAEGRFRGFLVNARMKNAGETEAQYLTAMTTAWASAASIRGCVGADGGHVTSALPGRPLYLKRPTSWFLAARLMSESYGRDAAYVADGPVGAVITDGNGNPLDHDEYLYPGLDAIRLVALRSFDDKAGTFINNAPVISTPGSDYVWAQHWRVMNRACALAYGILRDQLSRGVRSNPNQGPNGEVYIAEEDALAIEALVNHALTELSPEVTGLQFVLSRTDDIGSNGPVTLNGEVQVSALRYVKTFNVNAGFVRAISVSQ